MSVYEVNEGSIADGVLQSGDVIVSAVVNGNTTEITRQHQIIDMMLDVRVGDVISFNLIRDGEEIKVDIAVTEECLTEY